ncbi:hypothetical protein LEP1GSC036_0780 [Leptospira weilii str. 2006001853]|uniref:Lipoprotein n=3 Tax=Leptospira weilii TaxID=28184 RepID=A0A828Z4K1_9LEPT|nr:hypothetical protein [Leptospira weilii]EMM74928.1 hypothetical protein LEP1GSC038_0934 [Leptospira weilii str. 2006001855]EKR65962.1 hypothetical protein LEP1GSC036_0780 [Leptospira weilii str. 2006001853]EMN46600.1 hypothetical protein LEP1GSC086_4063 [Leptospira weilii str. LNT 1234]EMN90717.1 hypothetical protein LEP1GSC108_2348 [Leptospira weilii str. UI 13098]MCL8265925.1 hypothetical protein [Leptospira weilii]
MKTAFASQKVALLFRVFLFSLIFGLTSTCFKPTGEFGWALLDEEKLNILEKKIMTVGEYTITRENLIFPDDKSIYYIYRFSRSVSETAVTYVSLSRFQLGYNEMDVLRKRPNPISKTIEGSFQGLTPGKYLLKIAYEGDVIDEVEFLVRSTQTPYIEDIPSPSDNDIEKAMK